MVLSEAQEKEWYAFCAQTPPFVDIWVLTGIALDQRNLAIHLNIRIMQDV